MPWKVRSSILSCLLVVLCCGQEGRAGGGTLAEALGEFDAAVGERVDVLSQLTAPDSTAKRERSALERAASSRSRVSDIADAKTILRLARVLALADLSADPDVADAVDQTFDAILATGQRRHDEAQAVVDLLRDASRAAKIVDRLAKANAALQQAAAEPRILKAVILVRRAVALAAKAAKLANDQAVDEAALRDSVCLPGVEFLSPTGVFVVSRGGTLPLVYRDARSGPSITTRFVLDRDGDSATTEDQFVLAEDVPAGNGSALRLSLPAGDAPSGAWRLLAETTDSTGPAQVHEARALIDVRNVGKVSAGTTRAGGRGIAVFPDGSSVAVGLFQVGAVFGLGAADETRLAVVGSYDGFARRQDLEGRTRWARGLGGGGFEQLVGAAAGPDGSAFIAGSVSSSVVLGVGEPNETTVAAGGLLAKYLPSGQLAWARTAVGGAQGWGIAVREDGSVLTTGATFGGSITLGTGEPTETTLTSVGQEAYLAAYGADGAFQWAVADGGSANDRANGVAVLPNGSIVVAGDIGATATFGAGGPNEAVLPLTGTAGFLDGYVALYTGDGAFISVRGFGGEDEVSAREVKALSDGTFVVCGYALEAPATFDVGGPNETEIAAGAFVARYGASLELLWVRSFGDLSFDLDVLADDSVLVGGWFSGSTTLGVGELKETTLTSAGNSDIFVAKLTAAGDLVWALRAGGPGTDECWGIAAGPDGSFSLSGVTAAGSVFGAGRHSVIRLEDVDADPADTFVATYNADGSQ